MTTQKHNTLNPLTAKSAVKAPVSADRPVHAKAAAKQATKADLDKLAKTGIEQDIIVADAAEASVDAPIELAMSEGMDNPPGFGIGAVEGAAATEGTAALSPLAIGAGVLGVAAVAAIAGGGGSSGSKNNDNIQQKPPVDNDKKPGNDQPGGNNGKPPVGDTPTPGNGDPKPPAGEVKYGQATAQGEAAAPKVSPDGETKLTISKEAFTNKLTEAGVDANDTSKHFIRIDRIQASEMGGDHGSRMVRYPAEPSDASGIRVKAPADDKPTAYEVIKVEAGITLADAKAAAEKLGGKLMVVDNEAEANWLKAEFKNLLGSDQVGSGAWIGGSKLAGAAEFNAAVRNEAATDITYSKAAGEKLTAYVVEFENYKHPLTLNGQPVAEGQVINADDFDKLVWNGDGNTGGKISFSVVNSADATEAGATKGDLTITESAEVKRPEISGNPGGSQQPAPGTDPAPGTGNGQGGSDSEGVVKPLPTYPQNNEQSTSVTQDQADATLDKALFIGSSTTHPEFIKILEVTLPGAAQDNTTKALVFETAEGVKNAVVNGAGGTIVNSTFFHKISWNAALANGGTIRFIPVADEDGTHIKDSKAQTITITETPAAPNPPAGPEYDQDALTVAVAHNGSHTFTTDFFDGKANNVTHVKVSAAKDGTDNKPAAADGTLKFNGENVGADGKVIPVADANKLVWDANLAQGGSFTFVPVADAAGAELAGATEQTVTINEAAAPQQPAAPVPAYEADQKVHVAHDNSKTFDKAVFEGTNDQAKAKYIEITEIKNGAGEDAVANTLMKGASPLTVGAKVAAAEFDTIKWDASKNDGGSFSFKPVSDDAGTEIPGAPTQKITIVEHKAPPTYAEDNKTIAVAHDKVATIEKAAVAGTGVEADFIKITEINGSTDTTSASEQLKANGTGVKVGQTLNATEMGQLTWDTSAVEGGSFKFQPAHDADGTLLEGSAVKTITIDEHRAAPQYSANAMSKTVTTDQELTFDAQFFQGTQADAHPLFIKIIEIKNGDGQDAVASTLMKGSQPISVNDVIEASEFGNIKWDASKNENGSFKFVSVLDDKGAKAHLGAEEQTVTITENSPSAQSSERQAAGSTTVVLKSLIDIDQSYPI